MLADVSDLDLVDFAANYGLPAKEHIVALVVDSDAIDCMSLAHIASRSQQLDIEVTACGSLADAANALASRRYDVIYLEYWLAGETTIAFIHEMTRAGTPCIVLTDLNEPDIRRIACAPARRRSSPRTRCARRRWKASPSRCCVRNSSRARRPRARRLRAARQSAQARSRVRATRPRRLAPA